MNRCTDPRREALFVAAQALPAAERAAFLDRECVENRALRAEVAALLAAANPSQAYFDGLARRVGVAAWLHGDGHAAPAVPDTAAAIPHEHLGPYAPIRTLGAGGMGSVWLAERSDGRFEGRVAIKPWLDARSRTGAALLANGYAGESYVVYGRATGFPAAANLSALDGSYGFVLNAADPAGFTGSAVSGAGDVNGDGIDDFIVGAEAAGASGYLRRGQSYVVFGRATGFPPALDLSALNGSNGFALDGIHGDDELGAAVSGAGDLNGDGYDDLVIGSPGADPLGRSGGGASYVLFGRAGGFPALIDVSTLNGTTGFALYGYDLGGATGQAVSGRGDVNGDGLDDLIVGAPYAGAHSSAAGAAYVLFGRAGNFPAIVNVWALDGSIGFVLNGAAPSDGAGCDVAIVGDVNGDGVDDLVVGAHRADDAGTSYVVFARAGGSPPAVDLAALDGERGFVLHGVDPNEYAGTSVSDAGDVNGDGIDDLIVGASHAAPGGRQQAGRSYVVFGRRDRFPSGVELAALDGLDGFALNGNGAGEVSGYDV